MKIVLVLTLVLGIFGLAPHYASAQQLERVTYTDPRTGIRMECYMTNKYSEHCYNARPIAQAPRSRSSYDNSRERYDRDRYDRSRYDDDRYDNRDRRYRDDDYRERENGSYRHFEFGLSPSSWYNRRLEPYFRGSIGGSSRNLSIQGRQPRNTYRRNDYYQPRRYYYSPYYRY